jgi:hypothetical protein
VIQHPAAADQIDRAMRHDGSAPGEKFQIAPARIVHGAVLGREIAVTEHGSRAKQAAALQKLKRRAAVPRYDFAEFPRVIGSMDRHRQISLRGYGGGALQQLRRARVGIARYQ